VRSGRLKALAVTLPGFKSAAWFGIVGPPNMNPAIAAKVALGVRQALKLPAVGKRLADLSAEPLGYDPAETAAFMREEVARWGAVIRTAGVKLE
jgi:tripartite-type tricarboxylate transporter receptor subunit TctC